MSRGNILFRRSREAKVALLMALAIGMSLGPFAAAQQKQPAQSNRPAQRREENDIPRKRIEWFHKQRAFPLGFIPAGARLKALQHLDRMLRGAPGRQAGLAFPDPAPPPPSTTTWTLIGPQPISTTNFPPFTAGRVTALAADPADPFGNTIYAGGAQGGIWKTTNGGMSWTPLTDGQPSLATGSIAIAPSNSSIVYVGTGEQAGFGFDVYYGAGVLKSIDGGMTWTQTGTPPGAPFVGPFGPGFFPGGGARIGALAVHPTNPNLVLAGVQIFAGTDTQPGEPGIYCSSDGGATWALVVPGAMGTAVVYANTTTAYAALGRPDFNPGTMVADPDNDIYKATLPANPTACPPPATWTKIFSTRPGVPPQTSLGRIELGVAPSDPNTVYAAIADAATRSNNLLGMFKTSDGGTTWTRLGNTPDFCTPQCWFDNVVRVHPANPLLVFIGGAAVGSTGFSTLFRSADGGNSWTDISTGANGVRLHVDHHALAFAAGGAKLYAGNDGGVWSTTDVSSMSLPNWTNLNGPDGPGGLAIAQFYPGHSIHPSNQLIGFGGTQDNGTLKFSGDFAWSEVTCGDGGWTAVDPAVPSTVYAGCEEINIRKSDFSGNHGTFFFADNGIAQTDNVNFIPPFVIDPNPVNSQRLYFGTFRVWQSTDGATTWTPISSDLTGGGGSAAGGPTLTTIAVAPSNSSVVYVGSDDGKVHVAVNAAPGAATFSDASAGLPPRSITQIAIDPGNPQTAYVTFSGFSGQFPNPAPPPATIGDTQGHVFRTINGGAAWTDISCSVANCAMPASTDLPNTPVNDIVIDPDDPTHNTLYVATDIGVFKIAPGAPWSPVFPAMPGTLGLPRIAVFSLKLHEPSRTLRAATHGRSVWDLKLPNLAGTPTFNLSSISPTTANAGSASFTLTVNGNGFTANSQVRWNGSTTGVTTNPGGTVNQLTATIDFSLVAAAGTAQVTVFDPGQPSPGTTNALVFAITGPVPTVVSISPISTSAGAPDTPLTVNGMQFNVGSKVNWNGSPLPTTTFVNSTQLTTTIPQSLLAFGGVDTVTVVNPPPGGGPSNGLTFTVTAPPPSNDIFPGTAVTLSANSSYTNTVDSSGATNDPSDPTLPASCFTNTTGLANGGKAKSVWYNFKPSSSASVTADTVGSAYDTILSVWTGTQGNLTNVACNDDINPGVIQQSRVTFNVSAGTTYFFMITAFSGDGGKTVFNLSLSATTDFSLSSPTGTQTVTAGQPAMYTVTVSAQNGTFGSSVMLSCLNTTLPGQSSCSFNPASVTPGSMSANSMLTISTTANTALPAPRGWRGPRPLSAPWIMLIAIALGAAALATRKAKQRRLAGYLPLVVFFLLLLKVVGCGGGGGSTPAPRGTPPGTYTVTISGTSTGTSGTTQHTTTVTLVVR